MAIESFMIKRQLNKSNSMSTTTDIMGFQSPFGTSSLFSDPPQLDQNYLLQIRIIAKPIDFGGTLKFELITNLPQGETISILIYDVDSVFSNSPNNDNDTMLFKKPYTLGKANMISIPFNIIMEELAFKDFESDVAECYVRVTNAKINYVVSEVFKVNKGSKSAPLGAFTVPETGPEKKDRPKKPCKGLKLTTKQKAQFITVVMGESNLGDVLLYDVAWIYLNLVNDEGFDTALSRTSVYTKRNKKIQSNYKLSMYYLGQGDEFKNYLYDGMGHQPLSKYINGEYFIKFVEPKYKAMMAFLEREIFVVTPMSPYKGWHGQGYWRDLNLTGEGDDPKWYKARQYYWLMTENKDKEHPMEKLIVKLSDGNYTTYIFDEDKISAFFEKNPTLLPDDKTKVKSFDEDE